jgi:hypothetical protein
MKFIFENVWILFIAFTCANTYFLKKRSKEYIARDPALQPGYEMLFRNMAIYGNIPWCIIGIGNLSGLTHSMFDYFNPKAMNPMVICFFTAIFILWGLMVRWLYFKQGAEFLEQHPGLIRFNYFGQYSYATATQIKLLFPLALLGGIAGFAMMWHMNIVAPRF